MKVKFKFGEVDIEIQGKSKECEEFVLDLIPAYRILGMEFAQPGENDSAVEEIVRDMGKKKVCDPLARHVGNCGADDCPIVAPVKSFEEAAQRCKEACPHPEEFRTVYKFANSWMPFCLTCGERV